jgi:Peptidase family M1 domain
VPRGRLIAALGILIAAVGMLLASAAIVARAGESASAAPASCSPGAHTLSPYGARMYPETGNGGYTSVHTDVHMVYQASSNQFLPGNHVVLSDLATQCLTSFTLDFERTSRNASAGPDMSVESVTVNGQPASSTFVQPTYPGDPDGQNDPNPEAHEVSQTNPVDGPQHDPLPPACSPELLSTNAKPDSQDGQQCPANKLLITPSVPIPEGSTFDVAVYYTGRPGVHNDGDGTKEGWFRAPDGSLVSTEPVGSEDWMPLNDYPTAKPTYDFYETVEAGRVAIANGVLIADTENPPNAQFPDGSVTWQWESPAPIASYLVQSSVGNYELTEHTAADGVKYYEAQDESIGLPRKQKNLAIMSMQEEITEYESLFNGPYPFTSDGIVIGTPPVNSGEEEMQTMISFNSGEIELPVLYHENMHQWWGDNVTEDGYDMTFYKEGLADWMERYVFPARKLEPAAFEAFLIKSFDQTYARGSHFWTIAPSNPFPYSLFDEAPTYARPAAAYEALRQILGPTDFTGALQQIQRSYGGGNISEPQLEAAFHQWMPNQSSACQARLSQFFSEWLDTSYAAGGGANRPQITGPGLEGPGFYAAGGGCSGAGPEAP